MQVPSDSTIALVYLSPDSINFKHFLLLRVKIHLFVNLILQNVAKHIQLTAAEIDLFSSLLETRTLKSKRFILGEGPLAQVYCWNKSLTCSHYPCVFKTIAVRLWLNCTPNGCLS